MEYIKVTELKEILKDVSLSNNDLGKYGDGFEQAMYLVNKRLEAINLSSCCKSDSELLKAFLQYVNCSDTDSKVSFDLLDKYLNSL